MHEDDGPEPHPELTFFFVEDGELSCGVELGCWIMVKPELDTEPHEAAHEAPECTTLSLGGCVFG